MGILRKRHNETSVSRAGVKHRHLLEQPDVYFHGPIRFKIDGSYKNCLALLRPGHLSIRDRKNLEKIDATIRLTKGITFHTNGTSIAVAGLSSHSTNGAVGRSLAKAPEKARLVKFEIHTSASTGHGQAADMDENDHQETCQLKKYEFKCKTPALRDLWKAYILALSAGISPSDCGVHLLPGQIMQIDRLLEMEQKRRSSQRSLPPVTPRSSTETSQSTVSHAGHKGRHSDHHGRTPLQKSKSAHVSPTVATTRDNRHKFYKDSSKGTPSYFFEYISREMSEAILTMGHLYGNLLMRRSTSFPNSYALSFRSILNRNTEIFHYEIGPFKKNNSLDHYFEIKMEGKHPKFKCLNDVVKYFIRLTDGLAKCFTTNDLEILGIKQPPYATHYEPPADYEDHHNHVPKSAPPPPLPLQRNRKKANEQLSLRLNDPNSEEITVVAEEEDDDDYDEDDTATFTGSSISPARTSLPPSPTTPLQKSKSAPRLPEENSRASRRESQVVRFSIEAPIDEPSAHPAVAEEPPSQQKRTPTAASAPTPSKQPPASPQKYPEVVVKKAEAFTIPATTKAVAASTPSPPKTPVPIPPPPPPPVLFTAITPPAPLQLEAKKSVVGKGCLKGQPDRRMQFAPTEKNIFRIALECEEEVGKNPTADSIKDSSELARQLKGNVKSRVASLEVDDVPGKPAAPNFSRPQKKDFMGELAEKLKLRRQVVEQVC